MRGDVTPRARGGGGVERRRVTVINGNGCNLRLEFVSRVFLALEGGCRCSQQSACLPVVGVSAGVGFVLRGR